jgi:cardiolipin synthase
MDFLQSLPPLFWTGFNIISFLIRILSLMLIPQRHAPTTATAWLLVILLWPIPGIIIYSLLGTNLLPSRRLERHNDALLHFREIRERMQRHELPGTVNVQLPENLKATAQLAEHLGYMNAVGGNSVQYITDADEFTDTLVREIDAAQSEISLLYYIFMDDSMGHRVIEACCRAAKRGVVVRLLVDSVGSRKLLRGAGAKQLRAAGASVAEALPVRIYRAKAARFDLRNHRKLALFDRKTAITGSHNITEPTYGHSDNMTWKDVSLLIRGTAVKQLESVFIEDWYVETGEILDTPHLFSESIGNYGNACLQTVPSGPSYQTENYQRLIIASIISARQQVTITTPYLIPDVGLMQAIEVARLRGVKVRLAIPAESDHIIVSYASRAYYEDFLRCGVEVYLYGKGLLHAKTVTIDDDLAFVGSSNFDIRSFALNFELNVILYGSQENLGVQNIQNKYISDSNRLDEKKWLMRGHFSIALESITKLLSPLL